MIGRLIFRASTYREDAARNYRSSEYNAAPRRAKKRPDITGFGGAGALAEIVLEGVSKRWGGTIAVDQVDITVPSGSFVVLLGPSGCGKSTTLRLIAGLENVSAGRIRIAGRDVTELAPSERGIAMVFQNYALFPHLSVAENIMFGLRVRKVAAAERVRRLKRAADLLGLDALLERRPSQLSGGQQQRVALGRAIVAETPVCLMDEPLSNLDAQLRQEMRREIRALQQTLGITLVYVTHDQVEAMTMADRVVLMCDGRIEQEAVPHRLYAEPATSFAARFIGTPPMNLVKLADGNGGAVIRGSAGPTLIEGRGEGIVLGIRPEALRIAANGQPATITGLEYLGADTLVSCRAGSENFSLRVAGRVERRLGENVQVAFARDALHLFDAATGKRLSAS
jgi:sn-glycerol 3-phosphate transport system ATP-binding protein